MYGVETIDEKLKKMQEEELKLRKERREIEEQKKHFELEMARKLDEEKVKIQKTIAQSFTEEHQKKLLEKEEQMKQMQKNEFITQEEYDSLKVLLLDMSHFSRKTLGNIRLKSITISN